MDDYKKKTAEYEKYLADLDARLSALEAQEEVVHVDIAPENKKVHQSWHICGLCFKTIEYDDHGICRRCRSRLERDKELKKNQIALIKFNMRTTGSDEVDRAIEIHAGGFDYSNR